MDKAMLEKRLRQAHAKLLRAHDHLREASFHFQNYRAELLKATGGDGGLALRAGGIRFDGPTLNPALLSLAIGDAVQCGRAALDYVSSAIVAADGKRGRASFPISEDANDLEAKVSGKKKLPELRKVVAALPAMEALLRDKFKPYPEGNRLIWGLGKLANLDKHNLILLSVAQSVAQAPEVLGTGFHMKNVGFIGQPGSRQVLISDLPADAAFVGKPFQSLELVFSPEVEPFGGQGVFAMLGPCFLEVCNVIREVERASGLVRIPLETEGKLSSPLA